MRKRIDFKRIGRQIFIFLFILALGLLNLKAQQIVYSEDFSACPNGTITSPKWNAEIANATPDIFWVQSNRFDCRNVRGEGVWSSALIDISNYPAVDISVTLSENGQAEDGDYIRAYYNVDGRGAVLFSENGNKEGKFGSVVARQTSVSGNNLQIILHIRNNEINEKHSFDNILAEARQRASLWTGKSDSSWENPANWLSGAVPTLNDDVLIGAEASVHPVVSGDAACNSITVETNAALELRNDATISIVGNFTCFGKLLPGQGTINFTGSEPQLIELGASAAFYNLGINNRSEEGVSVSGNVRIYNRLHLAQGYLVASDTVMLLNVHPEAISGYSGSGYVAGKLQRRISSEDGVVYYFPVGTGGRLNYYPARIDVYTLSGTQTLTVSFEEQAHEASTRVHARGSEFVYDYLAGEGVWIVTPDIEPAAGWYDIRLSLENSSGLADNLFGIVKRPKGASSEAWTADFGTESVFGGEGRKLADGYALKKYCTSFSEFRLAGGGTAIPIELLDFKAELVEGKVRLGWSTASEIQNDFFTIEKSNGTDFKEVAKVEGNGNSSVLKTYSAVDEKPFTGISYYRLKQTDYNGKTEYSDVVSVKNAAENQLVVFPNPSEGSVKLKFSSMLPKVDVIVYNQHGSVSFNKTYLTQGTASILDVQLKEELAPGVYYMQVSANGEDMLIQQIVIQ